MTRDDHRRTGVSLRSLIAVAAALALATGCGAAKQDAAGSKQNPLVGKPTQLTADGRSNEAAPAGETAAGAGSSAAAEHGRTTPCRLVSRDQATTILGAPVRAPLRAPQGPTCIYRTKTGKGFVTVAVQPLDFSALMRQVKRPERASIGRHQTFCGKYGQQMLYAQIARGWVLSIAGPCDVAREFAAKALGRLS
jgi:ABC-type phosphate transport system substrate-binding protein